MDTVCLDPGPSSSSSTQSVLTPAGTLSLTAAPRCTTKKRSLAWVHYSKVDEKKAMCDICGETVKTSGNTTNLMTVYKHSDIIFM